MVTRSHPRQAGGEVLMGLGWASLMSTSLLRDWKMLLGGNKNADSFNVGSPEIHALYKQIYSISVALKSSKGPIREKYIKWHLRVMVTERGRETPPGFTWVIWAYSGLGESDGPVRPQQSLSAPPGVWSPQNVLTATNHSQAFCLQGHGMKTL